MDPGKFVQTSISQAQISDFAECGFTIGTRRSRSCQNLLPAESKMANGTRIKIWDILAFSWAFGSKISRQKLTLLLCMVRCRWFNHSQSVNTESAYTETWPALYN